MQGMGKVPTTLLHPWASKCACGCFLQLGCVEIDVGLGIGGICVLDDHCLKCQNYISVILELLFFVCFFKFHLSFSTFFLHLN